MPTGPGSSRHLLGWKLAVETIESETIDDDAKTMLDNAEALESIAHEVEREVSGRDR